MITITNCLRLLKRAIPLVFGILFLFSATLSAGQKEENQSLKQVIKLMDFIQGDKEGKIWPGLDFHSHPIIVTFNNGHAYAFNLKTTDTRWQPLELEGQKILFSAQDHWGFLGAAFHPSFAIENQTAYVFNMESTKNNETPYFPFVHERFHRHQFEHYNLNESRGKYEDQFNISNLELMQVEEMILADFWKAKGNRPEQIEYIKNFMAINTIRRDLLQTSSREWEDHQVKMEGLADYVSYRVFEEFPIPDFDSYQKLQRVLEKNASDVDISDRSVKWRHYGVGAALGYALDLLPVSDWKQQIEKGSGQIAILAQALPMSSKEIASRVEQVKQKYHFEEIHQKVSTAVNQYLESISGIMQAYQELPGIPVTIGSPSRPNISGGGHTQGTYNLKNGSTVSIKERSTLTTADSSWKLELGFTPFMLQINGGTRELKSDSDAFVQIDGRIYTLRMLQWQRAHLSFKDIAWKDGVNSLTSKGYLGSVDVSPEGKVYILFR